MYREPPYARFNFQETPYQSATQVRRRLKPYVSSGISTPPSSASVLARRRISSSVSHSTKNEKDGVKVNACGMGLSKHRTT